MTRKSLFLVLIILLVLLIPKISLAQEGIPGVGEIPLAGEIQKGQEKYQNFTAEEQKEAYLAREWTKIIEKNLILSKMLGYFNPVFKFLFGYEFSLSWAFVVALLVWIVIFSIFYPPIKEIFKQTFISFGITIAISAITANGIMPKTIELLAKIIKNIWWNIGTIIVLIFLAMFINIIWKELIKTYRKKREEAKLKKAAKEAKEAKKEVKEIKTGVEIMEKGAEEMFKGFEAGAGI